MNKISIKNIVIPVTIFIAFVAMVTYFLMLVPITIIFIPDTPEEIIQGVIKDMSGLSMGRLKSEDDGMNLLTIEIPRWKKIFYMKKLENNPYVNKVHGEGLLILKPY